MRLHACSAVQRDNYRPNLVAPGLASKTSLIFCPSPTLLFHFVVPGDVSDVEPHEIRLYTFRIHWAMEGAENWTFEARFHDDAKKKAVWKAKRKPHWGRKSQAEVNAIRPWFCPICKHSGEAAFRCSDGTQICKNEHMWTVCDVCYEVCVSSTRLANKPLCKNNCRRDFLDDELG